jgi:hypothetical protein
MSQRAKYLTDSSDAEAAHVMLLLDAVRDELGDRFHALSRTERLAWLKDWQARNPAPGEVRERHLEDGPGRCPHHGNDCDARCPFNR